MVDGAPAVAKLEQPGAALLSGGALGVLLAGDPGVYALVPAGAAALAAAARTVRRERARLPVALGTGAEGVHRQTRVRAVPNAGGRVAGFAHVRPGGALEPGG